jgi:hypothetical protein
MNYSRRKLTMDTDKIAALSGLLNAIEPIFKSDYLAGLWRDGFLNGLLCQDIVWKKATPFSNRATRQLGLGCPLTLPYITICTGQMTGRAPNFRHQRIQRLLTYPSCTMDPVY